MIINPTTIKLGQTLAKRFGPSAVKLGQTSIRRYGSSTIKTLAKLKEKGVRIGYMEKNVSPELRDFFKITEKFRKK